MTFLFDIGNVLLHVDFDHSLGLLFPDPPADLPQRLELAMSFKDELETGRVPAQAFLDRTSEILGYHGPRERFLQAWCEVFEPIEPMWRCVDQLAADGHRLVLFSNTNGIHMDYALAEYDVFRHFPDAVFSHLIGAMKPDAAFYQHAIDTLGIDPASTIYIDDLPENIATGRRFGLQCWQYHHKEHDAFLGWLEPQIC